MSAREYLFFFFLWSKKLLIRTWNLCSFWLQRMTWVWGKPWLWLLSYLPRRMRKRRKRSWWNGSPKLVTVTSCHSSSFFYRIQWYDTFVIFTSLYVSDSSLVASKGTLIICPASLVHHWKREIERHVEKAELTVYLYHGPNRERSAKMWENHWHTHTI